MPSNLNRITKSQQICTNIVHYTNNSLIASKSKKMTEEKIQKYTNDSV